MKFRFVILFLWLLFALPVVIAQQKSTGVQLRWRDCLRQQPSWYASEEAVRVADNVLLYQQPSGGWPKNLEMAAVLDEQGKANVLKQKAENTEFAPTIDNDATFTQMEFLARVFNATKQPRFKSSFLAGLDYLLKAQYDNGGWPQFFPLRKGYYTHITYNDGAMIGVMTLLREIVRKNPAYHFVGEELRSKAERALQKGVACLLKTQVVVEGKLTVWCAQHDETTFAPAPARAYEKISLSGSESVGIVRFLMGIEKPGPAIIAAIEAAVVWFERAKLTGIKVIEKRDAALPKGVDRVVESDANAKPLWARFYEIGTNRPIFCGRDGIIKYNLAEIEHERRTGYNWYSGSAAELLAKEYPAWKRTQAGMKSGQK